MQSCQTPERMRPGREQRCTRSGRSLPRPPTDILRDFAIAPPRTHGCQPPVLMLSASQAPFPRHGSMLTWPGHDCSRPGQMLTAGVHHCFRPGRNRPEGEHECLSHFCPEPPGGAVEVGLLVAERTTIPTFGPSPDARLRGFAAAAAGLRPDVVAGAPLDGVAGGFDRTVPIVPQPQDRERTPPPIGPRKWPLYPPPPPPPECYAHTCLR